MKRIISGFLMALLVLSLVPTVPLTAQAADTFAERYYTYTVTDSEAMITDCDTSISGNITIPSILGGYPVTEIDNYAFNDCEGMTSITIPDGVTRIGTSAFRNCRNLTSITIPDSVTSIGGAAFYGCSSLASITIPDSVTSIDGYTFHFCYGLTSITIPDSVTSIGDYAFYACNSLTNVTIPDSVTSIGTYAFRNCSSLKSITIGSGVTKIGVYAFSDCSSLTDVYITDPSAWCKSRIHYSDNPMSYANELHILDAEGNEVTDLILDDTVMVIPYNAFYGCSSLTSITISDSVTSIGTRAFYGCSSLTSITIPNSVTSIGEYAFGDCYRLSTVWYTGSEAQKEGIAIERKNSCLENATWHYNCCSTDAHIYTDACDTTCNSCDYVRSITHTFDDKDGLFCNICMTPAVPVLETKTDTTVTLVAHPGFQYSKDGENWYESNLFSNLSPATEYSFYQRIADDSTYYVGPSSKALVVTTDKSTQEALAAPTLESKTDTTVTLTYVSGHEYSKDGRTWQTSNIFSGLTSATEYTFYQRKAETSTSFASPASEALTVTTRTYTGTVTYEAKNSSYVPSNQIKVEGIPLTLSLTKPVRANCIFCGWSTKPYGVVEYRPGDAYNKDADLKLYAVWQEICVPCQGSGKISINCSLCNGTGVYKRSSCCGAGYSGGITSSVCCLACGRSCSIVSKNCSLISYKENCTDCNGIGKVKMPHEVTVAPALESRTSRSITLVQQEDMEYSKDGNTWQRSPIFAGLEPGTTYRFYQRYIENAYRSPAKTLCSALTVSTNAAKPKPEAPVLFSCSSTEVILVPLDGGEYSLDGVTWQTSNIFTNLQPDTLYTLYQRYAADGELDYSPTSDGLNVKTVALPTYTPGDVTGDGKINSLDGLMLLRYLNGWDVNITSPEAMDVNADGKVNSLDGLILMRYLNGWNVTLG